MMKNRKAEEDRLTEDPVRDPKPNPSPLHGKRRSSLVYKMLSALAMLLIFIGLYLVIKPLWIQHNQDKITRQLLELAERQNSAPAPEGSGQSSSPGEGPNDSGSSLFEPSGPAEETANSDDLIWVDPNDWVNSDEEIDYFIPDPDRPGFYLEVTPAPESTEGTSESSESTVTSAPSAETDGSSADTPASTSQAAPSAAPSVSEPHPTNDAGLVGLEVIGKLVMDKIGVNIPLVEGLSRVSLRYAGAHYEYTVPIGAEGNAAIFAHRSPQHGRDLNRLNEMQPGDTFEIVSGGKVYHYTVERNIVVTPGEIFHYFNEDNNGSYVILVTCDPIPAWTHRMLCISRLTSVTDA